MLTETEIEKIARRMAEIMREDQTKEHREVIDRHSLMIAATSRVSYFDMTDLELRAATAGMTDEDAEILRVRVMACRMRKAGQYQSAARQERRADSLEKRLISRKAA
jgi:cell fate (sporulation/competence/biofilm development) regulator YmcA (YheA/YmcA/DUF963 family)